MSQQPPLPRRDVEPLAPAPGSFDAVLALARSRRQQRLTAATGVVGVFLAGIWGGLALGGTVNQARQAVVSIATLNRSDQDTAQRTPSVVTTSQAAAQRQLRPAGRRGSSTTPIRGARTTHDAPASSEAGAGAGAAQQISGGTGRPPSSDALSSATLSRVPSPTSTPAALRARALVVDTLGAPVRGMYVYTGHFTADGFVPSTRPAGTTGLRGRFSVPCTGGPVLLTSWLLNSPLGAIADGAWAARFVSPRSCSAGSKKPSVVVVLPGTTVSGHVTVDPSCGDQAGPARVTVELWIDGDRSAAVRLSDLADGDVFQVAGVPAGTHVIADDHVVPTTTTTPSTASTAPTSTGSRTALTVATDAVTHDVTTSCLTAQPTPLASSPATSSTATPSPTPSPDPTTAAPSPTPTAAPNSSAPAQAR